MICNLIYISLLFPFNFSESAEKNLRKFGIVNGNMIHRFKRYSNDFGNGIITEMVSFDSLRAVPIVYQFIGSGYYNTYGTYYGYGDYTKEDNFYNYNYPQDYNRHSNTFHSPSKQTSNTYEMNNDFGISSYAPSFNSPSFYISDSPLYYRI